MNLIHHRTCNLCEAMCGVAIEHDGREVVSIRGDEQDVFSRGHICPKAVALWDVHADPDRLRQPQRRVGERWEQVSWDAALDDGCTRHACVGTFRANAFGLHDVHGNVNEWCLDGWEGWFYAWSRRVDPVAPWVGAGLVVYRGGSFLFAARFARSSQRFMDPPGLYAFFGGVRPARAIDR